MQLLKLEKDSVIWISVGLFGLEGARIFMHQDSITVLNKLDKSYSKLSWNEAGELCWCRTYLKKHTESATWQFIVAG